MSSFSIVLRPMQVADIPAVLVIEHSVHLSPWREGHFSNCLATGNLALVAELAAEFSDNVDMQPGQIVGYAILSVGGGEAELLNVAVAKPFQGKGVARQLIQQLINQVSDVAESVFLEVRESNLAAQALYESMGFNQVGVRPRYYPSRAYPSKADPSKANLSKAGSEDAFIYAFTIFPDA